MSTETIGVVGFGVIGQRWAAAFAHFGHPVRCHDPDGDAWNRFGMIRAALEADLAALFGAARPGGSITFFTDIATALAGVDHVQESGPENIETKRALLAEIERHVGTEVVIASSSSALHVTQMQADCARPERIVLAHPFNPAHIMPLVEIVGGERTDPALPERMRAFYEAVGKKPVILNREVTGHLALRLMGAMWREAIALVRDGVASAEDVDRAFVYGPGPKWGLQGSFISNSLNAAGIDDFLRKYGATYEAIWADLGDATLDEATRAGVVRSVTPMLEARGLDTLRDERDAGIVDILKAVAAKGAL
ncbi:3-hydroxyacyl-CoA dehydrogenase NAD-binding domain-containing protein [Acuticoccus sediminis]|uniref:3-hydroxyacyl-CoA dehydrogenase NAD-binding domain-containing protein n=1 Tax=Acuticoccus sediminis TaxID=2184697 RepID=UPI001CFE598B|nr:3-hydroxyacyl-CoA dehydrogenase NAD-binding domain-containing protein [Acuticoccus sediminis]